VGVTFVPGGLNVALPEALFFAAQAWPELRERIDPAEMRLIQRQLAAAVHGAPWDPGELIHTLFAHEGEEYRGWQLLIERPVRRGATLEAPLLTSAAAALRYRIEKDAWGVLLGEPTEPEQVETAAEERLWTVPMRTPPAEGPQLALVILERDGEHLAPIFQFEGEDSRPAAGVEEVNRLLGALDDPWGAASWWLTPHASLHVIPADALRAGEAETVTAAARAAGELA
jgi:hypothetical protein